MSSWYGSSIPAARWSPLNRPHLIGIGQAVGLLLAIIIENDVGAGGCRERKWREDVRAAGVWLRRSMPCMERRTDM